MAQAKKTKAPVKAAEKPAPEKKGFFARLFGSADKKLAEKSESCCCGCSCSESKPKASKKKK